MLIRLIIFLILFLTPPVFAAEKYSSEGQDSYALSFLTPEQVERLKECRHILRNVDQRPFSAVVKDLKKSGRPEANLQILEATAKTYADIVEEQNVTTIKSKEFLYSMVQLNMAFLQLGGDARNVGGGKDGPLNRLICRKLKIYLPPELFSSGAFHSTDEWAR